MRNNVDDFRVSNLWRTVAVALFGILASGFTGYLLFGLDSVKHSEIAGILSTQAPWVYDKVRISERIEQNSRRIDELMKLKEQVDRKETPLAREVEQMQNRLDRLTEAVWAVQTEQKKEQAKTNP